MAPSHFRAIKFAYIEPPNMKRPVTNIRGSSAVVEGKTEARNDTRSKKGPAILDLSWINLTTSIRSDAYVMMLLSAPQHKPESKYHDVPGANEIECRVCELKICRDDDDSK